MNEIKYTTKKTNHAYTIASGVEAFVYACVGIYCQHLRDEMISSWRFNLANSLNIISIVIFVFGFINFLYKIMGSVTFAEVYSDKIVGTGLQKISLKNFHLNFDQITDISCTGRFLNINTAAGNYKIVTNVERAKEIFDYYNSTKH